MSGLVAVVDVGGWRDGDAAVRASIAAELDAACREVGFLQLRGRGIPDGAVGAVLAEAGRFFALGDDEKRRWRSPSPTVNRGRSAVGSEALVDRLGADARRPVRRRGRGRPGLRHPCLRTARGRSAPPESLA